MTAIDPLPVGLRKDMERLADGLPSESALASQIRVWLAEYPKPGPAQHVHLWWRDTVEDNYQCRCGAIHA